MKKLINILIFIVGIFCLIYYVAMKITSVSFAEFFLFVGLIISIYGGVELKYNYNLFGRLPRVLRAVILTIIIICSSTFILVEGLIILGGIGQDTSKPDYVLVLGAGLRGTEISKSLKNRLDKALEFNHLYPDTKIVLSGGMGPGEDITEAEAMKRYMINNGVDEKVIITEDKSTDTYENFINTKKLINSDEKITLTVITNRFHTFRAKLIGEKVGFDILKYPANDYIGVMVSTYVREFFSVIKAFVFGRL